MSNYGPPPGAPQDPSGQPTPPPVYGQPGGQPPTSPPPPPAPGGYGAAPAGYGAAGYGAAPTQPYAHWGQRLAATLIDGLLLLIGYIPLMISSGINATNTDGNVALTIVAGVLGLVGFVLFFGLIVWNMWIKQGKTGYSIGKGVMGIKLVREDNRQPLGIGLNIGRQFVHVLDTMACYVGWLWPLWDQKRQTFADKILSTIVVVEPKQK